jgi:hypothetical protein
LVVFQKAIYFCRQKINGRIEILRRHIRDEDRNAKDEDSHTNDVKRNIHAGNYLVGDGAYHVGDGSYSTHDETRETFIFYRYKTLAGTRLLP